MQFVNMFDLRIEFNSEMTAADIYSSYSKDVRGVATVSIVVFSVLFILMNIGIYFTYRLKKKRIVRDQTLFMRIYNMIHQDPS